MDQHFGSGGLVVPIVSRWTRVRRIALAGCLLLAMPALAQEAPPPAAGNEPSATQAAPPAHAPGFLDALGRFIGQSREAIDSQLKNSQETLGSIGGQAKDAAGVAKDTAGTVISLPGTRIVSGRQLCPVAANGAPDCQQGATSMCRDKGFQGGRSLDIQTSQRCPIQSWIARHGPKEGECRTENHVTRAVCQ